eukprot:1764721-Pleurochrysis_carterae.AAC.6
MQVKTQPLPPLSEPTKPAKQGSKSSTKFSASKQMRVRKLLERIGKLANCPYNVNNCHESMPTTRH